LAHAETRLGRDEHLGTPAFEYLAENLFRESGGVDIRGVEEVDAGVDAKVDLAACAREIRRARLGEVALPAEGHRSETQSGNLESRATELTIVHDF
jgi:hypothetical protein